MSEQAIGLESSFSTQVFNELKQPVEPVESIHTLYDPPLTLIPVHLLLEPRQTPPTGALLTREFHTHKSKQLAYSQRQSILNRDCRNHAVFPGGDAFTFPSAWEGVGRAQEQEYPRTGIQLVQALPTSSFMVMLAAHLCGMIPYV